MKRKCQVESGEIYMSDLISRADAIEAMCRECGNLEEYGDCSSCGCAEKNAIEELPSATCDDCIWHTCNYNKVDWDGEEGYISKRDTIRLLVEKYKFTTKEARERLAELPSAEPQPKPISYIECANAMLKMWIDNVLTDGEYYRIMEKLNSKHMADMRGGEDE